MWQALAAYAVRGPVQAALLAFSTILLSVILPPLGIISGALIAIVWLRLGPTVGLLSMALAALAVIVVAFFGGIRIELPLTYIMWFWLPAVVMALVLRQTVSLDLAILAGGALALFGVLVFYLAIDDPSQWWEAKTDALIEASQRLSGEESVDNGELMKKAVQSSSSWLTGLSAGSQLVFSVASLLLARVWQARMFNPGGFQKEFHGLRFGMLAGVVGLAIVVASTFMEQELLANLAIVVTVVFALQGLAVIHALVAQFKLPMVILFVVYTLLLFAPKVGKLIGLLGIIDTWADFRKRFKIFDGGSSP